MQTEIWILKRDDNTSTKEQEVFSLHQLMLIAEVEIKSNSYSFALFLKFWVDIDFVVFQNGKKV